MILRVDDLDWEDGRRETRAAHTVEVTWKVDGGPVRRAVLDLSDENLATVGSQMEALLRADHTAPVDARGNDRPTEQTGLTGKQYRRNLRDWVDKVGLKHPRDPSIPAYITPAGNYSYPLWVERAYERFLKTGELPSTATAQDLCPVCGASGYDLCFSSPSGNSYGMDHARRPTTLHRDYGVQHAEGKDDDVLDSDRIA
jgi:hypothetical protein